MAEVRCPTCNSMNPEGAETCQVCGAQLTEAGNETVRPGIAPTKKVTSELERVSAHSGKTPIPPGEAPTKKDTGELEKALPAWLQTLRKGESAEAEGSQPKVGEPAPSGAGEEKPDRLSDLGSETKEEKPDWLAGLRSETEDEEIPEWLSGIRSKIHDQPGASIEENLPGIGQKETQELQPDAPAVEETILPAEIPDWLSDEKSEASAAPAEEGAAAPGEELQDWLAKLEADGQEGETPASPPAAESEWMTRLKEETTGPENASQGLQAETPEWLNNLPSETEPAAGGIPDWLDRKQPEPTATTGEGEPPSAASETPDWLSQLQVESARGSELPSAKPFETGSLSSSPEETPDWLSSLQAEASQESPRESFEVDPVPMKDETPAEALPSWLTDLDKTDPDSGGPPALIQNGHAAPKSGEADGLFAMEEQPDWLSTLKPEPGEKPPVPESGAEELADSLEKPELPSWVQAMRPVESVVADAKAAPIGKDQHVEQDGPLAGLRGVLPALASVGPIQKPPPYSIKLQVGDHQQQHAERLEQIVTHEAEPQAIRSRARLYSTRMLRWIISLVLLVVIGLTTSTGMQLVPPGSLYPPEMLAAMDVIGSLGPNSPVLVVFDYQPAVSGEMEAAAAPVIDHLLIKGARMTLLSTSPTGPALGEHFLATTQAGANLQQGQGYVNLGYLPGGAVGMLDFAQNPDGAAPYTTSGENAWQSAPLQSVQGYSDFAAVIILTDEADTGRAWIEQTASRLNGKPMLMVISAQAEPMIRPYYESDQIQGLVTGLAGGKAYENATQRPGPGSTYWSSFSAAMLAAEIMIVGGASWNAVGVWLERRREKEGRA